MSDIVSGVLKLTFGFLANKIRKEVAERLKDGDVTDEECRLLIVRELDDIKHKLEGLARKDLTSSVYFLQEGINGLYQSLFQFPPDENTAELAEGEILIGAMSLTNTGPNSPGSINEAVALFNAVTILKLHSNERLKSAIESFKLAREKATEAFGNPTLSIEDRIQASQVRMMARILEKLEDPEASVSDCLQYLKQLHDLGAIREIFSVMLDGGMKSRFNRVKRLNIASSVHDMNQILFDFTRKFTRSSLTNIFRWPIILLGKETHHPVFEERKLVIKLEKFGMQVISLYPDFLFSDGYKPCCLVINSKGEIVAVLQSQNNIQIFKRLGTPRTLCDVPMEEHSSKWCIVSMSIDAEDNIYVVAWSRKTDDHPFSFKLFIFDEIGNKNLETPLPFLQTYGSPAVLLAINKDGKIAIFSCEAKTLYIGNVCVQTNSYEVEERFWLKELNSESRFDLKRLLFSNFKGTKIIVNGLRTLYVYTENGQLQRKIEVPEEHGVVTSIVLNHVTKHILVKGYGSGRSNLLCFSESGELLRSSCLGSSDWIQYTCLISHPNGPVALVSAHQGILLQR